MTNLQSPLQVHTISLIPDNLLSVNIPFTGFYDTDHSYLFTDGWLEGEQEFLEHEKGVSRELLETLSDLFYTEVDFQAIREAYAREYAENFSKILGFKCKFEELVSPKEYNFTTDRIFVKMRVKVFKHMLESLPLDAIYHEVEDQLSPRDGFTPYYSNNFSDWDEDLSNWSECQRGVLIEAYLRHVLDIDPDSLDTSKVMEDSISSGLANDLVFGHASQKLVDFYNLLAGQTNE
jgi:hypothetical protein